MFGSRDTKAVGLMLSSILGDKEMHRSSMHIKVVHVGKFYYVQHWNTKIAIGKRGEFPFAMTTQGWNTVTTKNYLRALGFDLETKKMIIARRKNYKTGRMNNVYDQVLHIDGHPMMDEEGCVDYKAWYGRGGLRLCATPDFL